MCFDAVVVEVEKSLLFLDWIWPSIFILTHFLFSILGLKEHIEGAHEGKKSLSNVTYAIKVLPTSTVLKRHIAAVHEKKRPFECHLCHERFGQKAHLITHLKGKHKM